MTEPFNIDKARANQRAREERRRYICNPCAGTGKPIKAYDDDGSGSCRYCKGAGWGYTGHGNNKDDQGVNDTLEAEYTLTAALADIERLHEWIEAMPDFAHDGLTDIRKMALKGYSIDER